MRPDSKKFWVQLQKASGKNINEVRQILLNNLKGLEPLAYKHVIKGDWGRMVNIRLGREFHHLSGGTVSVWVDELLSEDEIKEPLIHFDPYKSLKKYLRPHYEFGGTLGLDAEFIIRNKDTKLPVSMIGKLGGDKQNPRRIPFGALQEDGVLAEINIDPARSWFEWERNISSVLKYLEGEVRQMGCYVDYNSIEAEYPSSEMQDERAWLRGCEPDWNCWTGEKNEASDFKSRLRTCGGHIHIGFKDIQSRNPDFRRDWAKLLDMFIGIPLYQIEPKNNRRELYGSPGSFRPKPYGAELRTPSNFWLKSSLLRKFVYRQMCMISKRGECWDIIRENNINSISSFYSNTKPISTYLDQLGFYWKDFIAEVKNGDDMDGRPVMIKSSREKKIKSPSFLSAFDAPKLREIGRNVNGIPVLEEVNKQKKASSPEYMLRPVANPASWSQYIKEVKSRASSIRKESK